jgi:hypothetical protein
MPFRERLALLRFHRVFVHRRRARDVRGEICSGRHEITNLPATYDLVTLIMTDSVKTASTDSPTARPEMSTLFLTFTVFFFP